MDKEIFREARKQYFKNFKVLFIIVAVLLAAFIVLLGKDIFQPKQRVRSNTQAPTQRVYDQAGTLTEEEIARLEELIAVEQDIGKADIVLLITNQEMGVSDYEWTHAMMNCADDFYDNGKFGYDKPYGDGSLILYNWYEDENGSQKGVWLSTSGKMERIIGSYEEDDVLDELERYLLNGDPVRGYSAAISRLSYWGHTSEEKTQIPGLFGFLTATLIAGIYAISNLKTPKAQVTTNAATFVQNHAAVMNAEQDNFIRKSVATAIISNNSSGGGSSRGGGSYGSHRSSGGHSHGGGGRRH